MRFAQIHRVKIKTPAAAAADAATAGEKTYQLFEGFVVETKTAGSALETVTTTQVIKKIVNDSPEEIVADTELLVGQLHDGTWAIIRWWCDE